MNNLMVLAVLVVIVVIADAWPNIYDNEFKRWSLSRRSYSRCEKSGGKCYSTSDCCDSFVCAAFDEYGGPSGLGLNPTMPGWCVHEKELEPCVSNLDCDNGKCVSLGQHRYCVPRPKINDVEQSINGGRGGKLNQGRLGASCSDSDDCMARSSDGENKMCCQNISMGRNGKKKKCDIVRPYSICISKRK